MAEDKVSALLEARIIRALEAAPQAEIPADFAAKVAALTPARPALVLTSRDYGKRAAVVCLLVLLVLMFSLAGRVTGTSVYWISIESIFCGQFALLAVWLVVFANSY